jgi:hypothetical protein
VLPVAVGRDEPVERKRKRKRKSRTRIRSKIESKRRKLAAMSFS